jgi:HPt (histidine-containing phosphotransfer) domain-containing protein
VYAERQAQLCQSLHDSFKSQWAGIPNLIKEAYDEIEKPDLFYQRKQRDFEKRAKKVDSSSTAMLPLSTIP